MKDVNIHITYVDGTLHNYLDYGIQIPMKNSRVTSTLESIVEDYGPVNSLSFEEPQSALEILRCAHDMGFLSRTKSDQEQLVLETYELLSPSGDYTEYYKPEIATKPLTDFIDRAYLHVLGTYESSLKALKHDFCYHLGGGMHHAMSDRPGGFCMFNDIVSVLKSLKQSQHIGNALVIDTDAHKGDGTAEMSQQDDFISTYSIHMKDGWPLNRPFKKSHIPSTCDVGVSVDDDYLSIHRESLNNFLKQYSGDLAIVVHGCDVYEFDALESSSGIALTREECLKRDLTTYEALKNQGIPQVWVMAGGYGDKSHLVFSQTIKEILKRYS